MSWKARREALREVATVDDDAACWDDLSRAKLKRALGLDAHARLFTANGHAEAAVTEALTVRGWQKLPDTADVRLADLRWVRPSPCTTLNCRPSHGTSSSR